MQLDDTKIAVRERTQVELLDLGLHMLRIYRRGIFATMLIGVLPLALLNHFLIGWMAAEDYVDYSRSFLPARYVWNMTMLVFLETPLASVFMTVYLGQAVFLQAPSIRAVVREVLRSWAPLLICQGILRGTVPAWFLLLLARDSFLDFTGYEAWVIAIAFFGGIIRGVRPFLVEVIALERNPWRAKTPQSITINRRMSVLHAAVNTPLFPRWMATGIVTVVLTGAVAHGLLSVSGYILNDWHWNHFMVVVAIPTAMWLVATYIAVVRFLSYLDLRIRNEGWEVELRLRAEAGRLAGRIA